MSRGQTLAADHEPHMQPSGSSRPAKNKKRASKSRSRSPSPSESTDTSPATASAPMLTGLFAQGRAASVPVFVASLGNPKPYADTLHSAGHTVLALIAAQHKYDAWRPFAGGQAADKSGVDFSLTGGFGQRGDALPTLWRCGALMNASGPAVKKAWLKWRQQNGLAKGDAARLVIVHDELERDLGAVSVRVDPKASARGHNGLKSVMASLRDEPFIRIGVGIGRPASRDRDAVSNYVLRKMTPREVGALETAAKSVQREIAEVEEGAVG